jgi:hypothetical protein
MLSNEQMKPNRFGKWAAARKRAAKIAAAFDAGAEVWTCTMTKRTKYTAKHASMFKAGKDAVYVQRGKSWDCLIFTPVFVVNKQGVVERV